MRNRYKLGIPLAAGLATGGYAASQDEDPGSALLAGIAGAAGGAGGLLAARQLAGKYAEPLASALQTGQKSVVNALTSASQNVFSPLQMEHTGAVPTPEIMAKAEALNQARAQRAAGSKRVAALGGLAGAIQGLEAPGARAVERGLKYGIAGLAVPAAAGVAGLGGVAAGAIPGAMGVPGFNQNVITDPELAGSSNTPGARSSTPTLRYIS
jgi:hypothetical protein